MMGFAFRIIRLFVDVMVLHMETVVWQHGMVLSKLLQALANKAVSL